MGEGLAGAGKDLLLLLLVGAMLGCVGLALLPAFQAAQTDADRAAAERTRAEASLVEAYTARDREANLHREQVLAMVAVVFAGSSTTGDKAMSVVVGALAGVAVGWLLIRWYQLRRDGPWAE